MVVQRPSTMDGVQNTTHLTFDRAIGFYEAKQRFQRRYCVHREL
jgi:hypothetical protein